MNFLNNYTLRLQDIIDGLGYWSPAFESVALERELYGDWDRSHDYYEGESGSSFLESESDTCGFYV